MTTMRTRVIGTPLVRLDGLAKVTGTAPYAFEQPVTDPTYVHLVQASVARGEIVRMDTSEAEALDGVLAVITHQNAPRLAWTDDGELTILQTGAVHFRGQIIGAAIAETPESARQAAGLVRVEYDERPHDTVLSAGRDDLYAPEQLNAGYPTDSKAGDVGGALETAVTLLDETYTTARTHNNPMEPHTTVAQWDEGGTQLTLYESTQGPFRVRATVAQLFGMEPAQVRVIAPHVGGGFGSKGDAHAPVVAAALAARMVAGRPVKLALTRQQMFFLAGYRTPTIQRIRLAADGDGRLTAICNDVVEQTSRIKEFAEQTGLPARVLYAAPNRRTTHRLAALDVPVPSWMRAPGETPGAYALECAMDELAIACGLDPIELRIHNEPGSDPESGLPYSSRNLVACLREGAKRFGWARRDPTPRTRWADGWLVGTGVASSLFPVLRMPGSEVSIRYTGDGRYTVLIGAADLGTGAWTSLTQISADALEIDVDAVDLQIGDTALPPATVAGGSSGTTSWGSAIVAAATAFRERHGATPPAGAQASAECPSNPDAKRFAMSAFGAQFAEVHVHADTGEIRVPRMLGIFAAGRIINPRTARSQLIGGMTMGLSMALHEASVIDPRFGHVVNHDFAEYHIATNADVGAIEVGWIDEHDPYVNPMGSKGIGEIGIVGAAAAVANAAYHATGIRVRDLPLTADKFLS